MKKILVITIAAIIALIVPFFLCRIIYPAAQVFLPEGHIILTPDLRIICTLFMAVIDYAIAGSILFIWCNDWFRHPQPHYITGGLTLLWCLLVGLIWYLAATD